MFIRASLGCVVSDPASRSPQAAQDPATHPPRAALTWANLQGATISSHHLILVLVHSSTFPDFLEIPAEERAGLGRGKVLQRENKNSLSFPKNISPVLQMNSKRSLLKFPRLLVNFTYCSVFLFYLLLPFCVLTTIRKWSVKSSTGFLYTLPIPSNPRETGSTRELVLSSFLTLWSPEFCKPNWRALWVQMLNLLVLPIGVLQNDLPWPTSALCFWFSSSLRCHCLCFHL